MQLHAFDAFIGGYRLRGFTRDRAGAKLRRRMEIAALGIFIKPHNWKYFGKMTATQDQAEIVNDILLCIKRDGFAVTMMPPIPTKFYVFDLQLDICDLRIYSSDRELVAFRRRRRQFELGTKGDEYLGEQEVLKGEIEIDSKETASQMGISDYEGLLERGFCFTVLRTASLEQNLTRKIFRKLREKEHEWGVKITSFRVGSIKVIPNSDSTDEKSEPQHTVNVQPPIEAPERDEEKAKALLHHEEGFGGIHAEQVTITVVDNSRNIVANHRSAQSIDEAHITEGLMEKPINANQATPPTKQVNNAWINGSFYLVALAALVTLFGWISNQVQWHTLPVVFIAGLLSVGVIGAFQLRNDDRLSENTFIQLMIETYKRLPLLRKHQS